ncbi:MAG: insulinase family protein [Crocinitomicaceae bacterium]
MKRNILFIFILSLLSVNAQAQLDRSKRPPAGEEPKINIPDPIVYKLDNGLTVILVEDHNIPKVSYNLTVDVPTFNEKQFGGVGVSDLAGELLNSGSQTLNKDQLDKKVDLLGASFNANSKGFFASSLKKHTDELLNIVSDVILNPGFPQDELDRIKKTNKSGLETAKSDPGTMAANVSNVANFGKSHPYGEVQTADDVDNISLDHVKMYYKTFFKPNISYLVVVGDITLDELKAKVEKAFGSWKKADVPNIPIAGVKVPTKNKVYFVPKKGAVQSEIRITFPLDLKPGAEDEMAAKLMNSILGGGVFSGRLMQNLREDKAYTYGCRSSLNSDEVYGDFMTTGSFRNEVTDSAIVQILGEIQGMLDKDITDEEIYRAKKGMSGSFVRSLESPSTIAYLALRRIKYNLPADYYQTYLQRLEKISKDDLKAMAKKYLRPQAANIVVVGNEDIAEKLVPFDADGKLIKMDYKGDVIKDIKPVPAGVSAEQVLKDYVAVKFGTSDLKKLEKMRKKVKSMKSVYEMSLAQVPQPLEMEMYAEKPNKFIRLVKMGTMVVQKSYFDGESGGSVSMQGSKKFSEEENADYKTATTIFEDIDLLNTENVKLELLGIEEVDGKEAYKLNITEGESDPKTYFIDLKTNLPLKIEAVEEAEGQKTFTSSVIQEWKDIDGVKYVSKMEMNAGGMTFQQTLKSVEMNVKVDQNLYGQ